MVVFFEGLSCTPAVPNIELGARMNTPFDRVCVGGCFFCGPTSCDKESQTCRVACVLHVVLHVV